MPTSPYSPRIQYLIQKMTQFFVSRFRIEDWDEDVLIDQRRGFLKVDAIQPETRIRGLSADIYRMMPVTFYIKSAYKNEQEVNIGNLQLQMEVENNLPDFRMEYLKEANGKTDRFFWYWEVGTPEWYLSASTKRNSDGSYVWYSDWTIPTYAGLQIMRNADGSHRDPFDPYEV